MRGFMVALAPALLMASCAATSTGPVAGFDGSWTISKRGVVATQPEALTRAATQEATAHCAVQGKRFAGRRDDGLVECVLRALQSRVKAAQGINFVAKKFKPDGEGL